MQTKLADYLASTGKTQTAIAKELGVSRQAIDRHANGAAAAISYADLAKLAEDPNANPEAVIIGAAQIIESVRAQMAGDTITIAARLDEWMTRAQEHDGREDCKQLDVKALCASLAFMHDRMSLPLRRNAVETLNRWVDCKERELDADLASLGYARALAKKLAPVDAEGVA